MQNLSPSQNWRLITEGLFGTAAARALHQAAIASPLTIEAALEVVRRRWPHVGSRDTSAPIFIFSAGWRSGSTFLQRLLMSNPEILIWGEPYRYADVVGAMAEQVKAFTASWPKDSYFIDRHTGTGELKDEWVANLYPAMTDFLESHLAFFERLFVAPAAARGRRHWGFKEVALTVDHACYLRWLYPNAKFIFLYRNPYKAYQSYRRWRSWYRSWPEQPVFTAHTFGSFWRELTADFTANSGKVGGLLIKYEDLRSHDTWRRLEEHLAMTLADPASLSRVDGSGGPGASSYVPRLERYLLRRQVEPLGSSLGYSA